jgi:hypothetical protein
MRIPKDKEKPDCAQAARAFLFWGSEGKKMAMTLAEAQDLRAKVKAALEKAVEAAAYSVS